MLNELKAINRDADTRSYFVKEKSFGQLQPMEVLRHNICHLVNLLAKLASAAHVLVTLSLTAFVPMRS